VIVLAILLLSTEACHLCELAQQVLQHVFIQPDMQQLAQQYNLEIYRQDIIDEPNLLALYAEKIPVILDEVSGLTLEWPFNVTQATEWFEKVSNAASPVE
jgi:hypothetical protein